MSDVDLSIGELARQTGLSPATIRVWEARYGFPAPARGTGGHRSYRPTVIAQLRQVVADREAGLGLPAAINRAQTAAAAPVPSLHTFLRRQAPSLPTQALTKRALAALTRALEDEGHSRAGVLSLVAAGFQEVRHYERVRTRWHDLVAAADLSFVFADFGAPSSRLQRPVHIHVDQRHPLNREWFVIWVSDQFTACLSGRELPGQSHVANRDRILEAVWTVDPGLVTAAARSAIVVANQLHPGLDADPDGVHQARLTAVEETEALYAVANRMLAILAH